ncbi:MAG: hypothetical protein OES09_15285 [Gammaproteobacteria bacterium]|nr:hypothetical protein [Gammaproteobacteria bacterium]
MMIAHRKNYRSQHFYKFEDPIKEAAPRFAASPDEANWKGLDAPF